MRDCSAKTRQNALLLFDRIHWSGLIWAWPENFLTEEIYSRLAFAHPEDLAANDYGIAFRRLLTSKERTHAAVFEEARRVLAERCQASGYRVVPLYDTEAAFRRDFSPGEHIAYHAALSSIPVVSPDKITPDHILEFRADPEALRKYRDLRLWLDDGLRARTESHARELIEQRVEDYKWAISKHGVDTALGTVSEILDWKKASIAAVVGVEVTRMGGPTWGAIAGGLVVATQVGVSIAEKVIAAKDVQRGKYREVAPLKDPLVSMWRGVA